jgi:tryptophan synthase beta chain
MVQLMSVPPQNGGTMTERAEIRSPTTKYLLDESDLPRRWYNIIPDLPSPPPPVLHPGRLDPVGPDDLAPLFPMALIMQEVSGESFVDIPEPVRDVYRLWRPTPLIRAHRFERALGTPAKIYYKYEGTSPSGSHKPNTAVPQAYYNAAEGVRRLTTETGAGQWGSALAFACALFDLECEVWQVAASYQQKPYRRSMMQLFGATVHSSPSQLTAAGRAVLADQPDSPGSLGIAISEAVEMAAGDEQTRYALGSVLNHVLLHQTIIGEEALLQMADAGETPDVLVGCTGGGSNFAGLSFPFLREKLAGRMDMRVLAVEPAACPSLTRGRYAYDFGDTAGMTPLVKMRTLGHDFVPDPIHAGGLRYHGMSPLLSHIYELGLIEAEARQQRECFAAGVQFARAEGIVPAPEPTHALAAVIDQARQCAESGEERVILMALCGHGHFDMSAYDSYLAGDLVDYDYPQAQVDRALERLPQTTG